MFTAIIFMALNCLGYILALTRGPFWGLLVYINIYFNVPTQRINWWAAYLPLERWSLITSVILIISLFLHRDKVSLRKLSVIKWLFAFTLLSIIVTYTSAVFHNDSSYTYKLITYCITAYIIIRVIKNTEQYRLICLFFISLAVNLALKGYLSAERVNDRLEGFGTGDTANANHFALLLINIIPFTIPFIFYGKWYERIVCLIGLPFLLNTFILCNSRGMTIAFMLGMALVFLTLSDKVVRKYIILTVLAGAPIFVYLADAEFIGRMESLLLEKKTISTSDEDTSAELSSGRTVIWQYGYLMAKDHPFGAGSNAFKQLARYYMPPELLTKTVGKEHGIRAAHNTYLQTVVEQGILGLIVILALMFHTLVKLRSSIKKMQGIHDSNSFLGLSIFALYLSFSTTIFAGLTSSRLYYEFFWWQIALTVVVSSLVLKKSDETTESA